MPKYSLAYDELAVNELKALRRYQQVQVVTGIEEHLQHRPTRATGRRIRKLDPPVLAAFRLRIGDLRVFYDVDDAARTVHIVAVRAKGRRSLGEIADGSSD